MGKNQKKQRQRIVCFCYCVPEDEIVAAIRGGATSLMEVRRKTNANTGCGGCGEDVKRLIRKHASESEPASSPDADAPAGGKKDDAKNG